MADPRAASHLFILVHGLGGNADRPYVRLAANEIVARGHACLRISMRGSGDSDPDFFHAGLFSDIRKIIADPSLSGFASITVIGFSIGGHICLHLGLDAAIDERLRGIVAVCPPLDLAGNQAILDNDPRTWIYRRYILRGLEDVHHRVAGQRWRFRTIHDWDARVVVPRWGFPSVAEYYATQSVGPRLPELKLPCLLVAADDDPIVAAETLRPDLARAGDKIEARWVKRGGHVGFSPSLDLGMGDDLGLIPQIVAWSRRQVG